MLTEPTISATPAGLGIGAITAIAVGGFIVGGAVVMVTGIAGFRVKRKSEYACFNFGPCVTD